MKCKKCQFENLEGMKFCGGCGAKLEKICSECGFSNPTQYNFCGECGSRLSTPGQSPPPNLSLDRKLAKMQRYLPEGLTEKILSERERIEGERKQVTVMFCDMEGFTPMVEQLGPEESYNVMDEVYEILIHKVHDYGGTVNEMTGDGIMALFGAPIALEDAPQRSIRSALAIHREMSIFSNRIKQQQPEIRPVKMRIGINTGPVVVGDLGNDLRVDFKAVGDTVNLASRLGDLSEPGTTYVTENTFKLAKGLFRFEALGEKQVKGKKQQVRIYRVLAASSRRTRFDVSAEVGLTPFVSRERELKLLLDGFERVKEGRGKAFSIMSDAGVGKSRLLFEFRKAIADEYVTFLEGKCLSYSSNVPYYPITDILKSNFNIEDRDDDSEILKKVKKGLKILGADEPSTMPYILELLSVVESGVEKVSMSPEGKRDRIIEALKRIVSRGSELRPLILAIEDLHWIDGSSEELLKHLLSSIPGSRIMMIFTYRPTFVCTWTGKSFHSQLNLNRLSEKESRVMLSYLIGEKEPEESIAGTILDKTEGVPFFIEEFVKSLKDMNLIERKADRYELKEGVETATIPSTIHDVVMARVDSLPQAAKELAQAGSAIEREFDCALIRKVVETPEEQLLSNLSVLKETELLYERGVYPDSVYIFKHALTREVIYDSILGERKKRIHGKIGDAIAELNKEKIDEYCSVLAEHYIASENYEKAAEYSLLAARAAESVGSLNDAIEYSKKAVDCLEKLPESEKTTVKIIDARTALGLYLLRLALYKEARAAIAPVVEKTEKIAYKKVFPKIYSILGTYEFHVNENVAGAFGYLDNGVKTARDLNDNDSLSTASFRLGLSCALTCKFQKGIDCFEQVFRIMKAANILWGAAAAKGYQGLFCYCLWGRLGQAQDCAKEAIRIAEESGDIYSKAIASTAAGWVGFEKGELDKAEEKLLNAIDYCEKIRFDIVNAVARVAIAETYYERERYEKAQDHFIKGTALVEPCGGFRSFRDTLLTGAAMAKVKMGANDIDLPVLCKYARETKLPYFEGWKLRYLGAVLLHMADFRLCEAEDWVKKAIIADDKNGMMLFLGKDYKLYADILKRKGDNLQARKHLLKAIEIFKECGAIPRARQAEKELSEF